MANADFAVGNLVVSEYDPVTGNSSYVASYSGDITYSAKITTSEYNPITGTESALEYPLVLGVVKSIPINNSMTITLTCLTTGAENFSSFKNGDGVDLPYQGTEISYNIDSWNLDRAGAYRFYEIKTASNTPDTVTLGDTISYDPISGLDIVSQTGAVAYEAKIQVEVYDAVSEVSTTYDTPIPLGVATAVDFKRQTARKWSLICTAFQGKRFTGASNGTIEIAFDKYAINYSLSDPELPPNPDSSRQYLIQTTDDSPTPTPEPTVTNNYRLTRAELKEFQKQVYASQVPDDPRKPAWEFVSNVFIVPFVVPASEVGSRENIKARDITFNVVDRLKGNSIALDLGTIEIPGRYGNSLDYYNASVSLYMPFKSGQIELDPFQVIGGSIRLEYQVNPSDGNTTLNIYNEGGELIQSNTFKMGSEYPFYSFQDIQDKFYSPENVVNLIRSAYVTVKIPDYSGVAVPKVTVSGNLEGVTGRVDFSEVSIDNIPYADEYDELISKLKAGIVIK